jgi:hypothetical protein
MDTIIEMLMIAVLGFSVFILASITGRIIFSKYQREIKCYCPFLKSKCLGNNCAIFKETIDGGHCAVKDIGKQG